MTKTILIPTDFTVKSLNLAKIALQKNLSSQGKVRLILVHGFWMSTSISDLLFYSKKSLLDKLETADFRTSCKLLLGKYENKIDQMSIDLFSGRNQSSFENYLEAHNIDEVYMSPSYKYKLKNSCSFDLNPFIAKSKVKQVEVNWELSANHEDSQNELSALFFTHAQIAH